MEDTQRLKLHYVAAMVHKEVFQQLLNTHRFIIGRMRWKRGARACSIWVRPWLHQERRRQFGIYDQLMVELRREVQEPSRNFIMDKVLKFKDGIFFANVQTISPSFYFHQTLNLQCKLCEKHECQGDVKLR